MRLAVGLSLLGLTTLAVVATILHGERLIDEATRPALMCMNGKVHQMDRGIWVYTNRKCKDGNSIERH